MPQYLRKSTHCSECIVLDECFVCNYPLQANVWINRSLIWNQFLLYLQTFDALNGTCWIAQQSVSLTTLCSIWFLLLYCAAVAVLLMYCAAVSLLLYFAASLVLCSSWCLLLYLCSNQTLVELRSVSSCVVQQLVHIAVLCSSQTLIQLRSVVCCIVQ